MRIKRFEAKDNKTALALVKEELGDEAVILATRTIPADKNNPLPMVEIVAAMDYDLEEIVLKAEDQKSSKNESQPVQTYGYQTIRRKDHANDNKLVSPSEKKKEDKPFRPDDNIKTEAHDLRLRFANLLKSSPALKKDIKPGKALPNHGQKTKGRSSNPEEVKKWRDSIINKIQLTGPKQKGDDESPSTIALVGATGVGKTTTAAKMAAWFSLRQNKRVALLSMDCYRIGATDQLRTYARIMRMPCEIVLRKKDLNKALARHQDKDVIIIDTAGKSPYDEQHIGELKDWFSPCEEIEPHLVLSATTKKEDLQTVIKSFAELSVSSLILTKLDETRAYAALCQQVVSSSLPVSYLSTGQRVPEDFLMASKDFMDTLFKKGWQEASAAYL